MYLEQCCCYEIVFVFRDSDNTPPAPGDTGLG